MGARNGLPKWVERNGSGFRGWAPSGQRGRKVRLPTRTTPEEAHADAVRAREALEAGQLDRAAGRVTLRRAVDIVEQDLQTKIDGGTRREGTLKAYRAHLTPWLAVFRDGEVPLDSITPDHVEAFTAARQSAGLSPNTIRKEVQALGRVFNVAMRKRLIASSPMQHVERIDSVPAKQAWMTREQIMEAHREIQAVDPRSADLVLFTFATGLRRAELAAFDLERDLDLERSALSVVKGKKRPRTAPLAGVDEAREFFARLHEQGGYLAEGETQTQRENKSDRMFRTWSEKLKLPELRAHALRHSLGAHLGRFGVPKYRVRAVLGHISNQDVTDTYLHEFDPELRSMFELAWRDAPRV